MFLDIPYLLPKSYAKLANERPAASDSANVVDCQVSNKIFCVTFPTKLKAKVNLSCLTK